MKRDNRRIRSTQIGEITMTVKGEKEDSRPLKTNRQVKEVVDLLRNHTKDGLRNELLFTIGINNGIRTKDIVTLKVDQVLGHGSTTIIESKTGKSQTLNFNVRIQKLMQAYMEERKAKAITSEWLFPNYKNHREHITTQAVYRMFKRVSQYNPHIQGLTAHTMRRTYGYFYYKKTHDIVTLMKMFNHSSQAITLRYIGISSEEIEKARKGFEILK